MKTLWILLLVTACLAPNGFAANIPNDSDESNRSSSESEESNENSGEFKVVVKLNELDKNATSYEEIMSVAANESITEVKVVVKPSEEDVNVTANQYMEALEVIARSMRSKPEGISLPVQLCAILNPGQNLSALNATAAQKDRLVDLMLVLLKPIPDGVELQNLAFFRNTTCQFLGNPQLQQQQAKLLGLSVRGYHQFEKIRTTTRNNSSSIDDVTNTRELCRIMHSAAAIADLTSNTNHPSLTAAELVQFEQLVSEAKSSDNSSRHSAYENMCMFLNETVSPTEQAQALGIDLELYERLVTIRKNNLEDESLAGQMNLARQFCEALSIDMHDFAELTAEKVEQSNDINIPFLCHYFFVFNAGMGNSERIADVGAKCSSLNDGAKALIGKGNN